MKTYIFFYLHKTTNQKIYIWNNGCISLKREDAEVRQLSDPKKFQESFSRMLTARLTTEPSFANSQLFKGKSSDDFTTEFEEVRAKAAA